MSAYVSAIGQVGHDNSAQADVCKIESHNVGGMTHISAVLIPSGIRRGTYQFGYTYSLKTELPPMPKEVSF